MFMKIIISLNLKKNNNKNKPRLSYLVERERSDDVLLFVYYLHGVPELCVCITTGGTHGGHHLVRWEKKVQFMYMKISVL